MELVPLRLVIVILIFIFFFFFFYFPLERKRQREKGDYWGVKLNHKQRNKIVLLSTSYALPRQHSKSFVGPDLFLVTTMRFCCDPCYMWANERKKSEEISLGSQSWRTGRAGIPTMQVGSSAYILSTKPQTHACTHTPKCIHTRVHTHKHTQATPAVSCGFTWFIVCHTQLTP